MSWTRREVARWQRTSGTSVSSHLRGIRMWRVADGPNRTARSASLRASTCCPSAQQGHACRITNFVWTFDSLIGLLAGWLASLDLPASVALDLLASLRAYCPARLLVTRPDRRVATGKQKRKRKQRDGLNGAAPLTAALAVGSSQWVRHRGCV